METTESWETPESVDGLYNNISAACWCIATPIALLTNAFSLLVVHRSPLTDDVSQVFIASVSAVVIGLTLCLGPTAALTSIMGGQWILGDIMCTAQSLLLAAVLSALSVVMFIFSIERYVFLAHPLRYPVLVTIGRARLVIAGIALVVVLVILCCGFLSDWHGVYMSSWHACIPSFENHTTRSLYLCAYLIMKLVPAVIGYAIHCSLLLIARRHLRRIIADMPLRHQTCPTDPTLGRPAAVVMGRRLRLNLAQWVMLSVLALFFLGMDLIPDLACFYAIPNYLVLPGNLVFLFVSCLLPTAHMYSNKCLRRTAGQTLARCCCCHEALCCFQRQDSNLQSIIT